MNCKRHLGFVFAFVLMPTMASMSLAESQEKSEWQHWNDNVRETILPMFADLQRKHPEYHSAKGDAPCEVTFDVSNEREVVNIHRTSTSGLKDFDTEASSIIFFARNSPAFSFPSGVTDKFVRCRLSFYPHGKVSKLEVAHPGPSEVFEDKSSISVPVRVHKNRMPPDIVSH